MQAEKALRNTAIGNKQIIKQINKHFNIQIQTK